MIKILILFITLGFAHEDNNNELIYFESANPFSFEEIITDLDNQERQEVFGKLTLPKNFDKNSKYPLIIGIAGSLNWGPHHLEYMKMYHDLGFATFELQSFDSRNVKSTVGSQIEVTAAMMILDSYLALEKLSNHPNIDVAKAGITGWSLGGTSITLFSLDTFN